jgi:hypothetical protein
VIESQDHYRSVIVGRPAAAMFRNSLQNRVANGIGRSIGRG